MELDDVELTLGTQTPQARAHQEKKAELAPVLAGTTGYDMNPNVAGGIVKVSYTHMDMIDTILRCPTIRQNELAERYGYTAAWISRIISSDAFKAMFIKRRKELGLDDQIALIVQETEERLTALTNDSLALLHGKLSTMPADLLLKTAQFAATAKGYGAKATTGTVNVQASFVVALPSKAPDAETWLRTQRPEPQTIEAEGSGDAVR